jgi:hypothetical protein
MGPGWIASRHGLAGLSLEIQTVFACIMDLSTPKTLTA